MPICSSCNGRKKIEGAGFMKYTCDDCNGTGRESEASKIQAEIDELKSKQEEREKQFS